MRSLLAIVLAALTLSGCFGWGFNSAVYDKYSQRNGLYVANASVNTSCISPELKRAIGSFERKFGRKIVVNSGYRDPIHNLLVSGADGSYHMKCMATDFFIPGVSKGDLIAFAMRNPLVGGLGCYPGRDFIHVDVRKRPQGWKKPVTFSGC